MTAKNNYFIAVNYHYIDDEKKFKSGIYPVSPARLSKQIDLLRKDFELIGEKEVLEFLSGDRIFKKPACLLTFDDGLKCQYKNAFPILKKHRIPAVFFINSRPAQYGRACQIHKVHYLMAILKTADFLRIVKEHYFGLTGRRISQKEISVTEAKKENSHDSGQMLILKYLINFYIAAPIAEKIIDLIFRKYCPNEKRFCEKLYMSKNDLKTITRDNDMFSIGLHTASHLAFPQADFREIEDDLRENYDFLTKKAGIKNISGFSYPMGAIKEEHYQKVKNAFKKLGIKYALTMNRGTNYAGQFPYLLNRFDTNDLIGGKHPKFYLN
jgi:peptidoglycan/xylan/chitin deacetylase (PgdA/CDA1 family)